MKKNLLFLLISLIYLNQIFSQKNDKYLEYQNKIFLHQTNLDSLEYYINKLSTSNDPCFKYDAKIHRGRLLYKKNNYVDSENISINILNELKDKDSFCFVKIKVEALNRLFWIRKNQKLYNEAYQYLLEIEKEIQKIPVDHSYYKTISITLKVNSALIKSLLGYYDEARSILKGYLKIYKGNYNDDEHKDYTKILNESNIYNIIGDSYLKSSTNNRSVKLDSASYYFKKAFKTTQRYTPPHKDSETLYYLKEAEVLIAKKKFKESLSLIQKYSKNSKEFNTVQDINSLKAICFYNLNKKDSAFFYAKSFLKNFNKSINNKERLIAIYDILSNLYFQEKRLDSAFKYSELTIAELKLLDKTKNEVNKSHYLHNYNDIQNLNADILKKGKNNNNVFILLFCVALLSFALIYFYIQRKNKGVIKDLKNLKKKQTPQKKEYNIDLELEQTILQGITELKNSTDFLNTDFNIQSLSKQLNTNTSYVSYIINKEFNQSFKEYLTQLRIEYLIERLKNDKAYKKYTIKSLAEEIGYTNASAFTRAFKKLKGITPSEFIKSID